MKAIYSDLSLIYEFKLSGCRIQILRDSSETCLAAIVSHSNASDEVLQTEIHELLVRLSEQVSVDVAIINSYSWLLVVYDAIESLFYQHYCY